MFSTANVLFVVPQKAYRKQLETMLLQNVMPAFSSPYGHIRAKACWLCGQFADIEFREGSGQGTTFQAMFTHVVKALRDADLPVSLLPWHTSPVTSCSFITIKHQVLT